jgi:hypothetical protein
VAAQPHSGNDEGSLSHADCVDRIEGTMQKPTRKKRQAKKPVPNVLSSIKWGWVLAGFAVVVGCLLLAAFATSQSQASTDAFTIRSPAASTSSLLPIGSDTPGTAVTQQVTGIFPLSAGGPIPVPANVLHPTNVARVVVNNVLTSIYAGSMTRTPAIGALAILQENLTTGQQSLHLYQTSQPVGALTILAMHNDILTLSTPNAHGTFDLGTDQFHF